MKNKFLDPVFSPVLKQHDLADFDALWTQEGSLVEEGNVKHRSGHSHVVRLKLEDSTKTWTVYMKRQENYITNRSRIVNRPRAICEREFNNINAWRKLGVPTMQALYFEQKNPDKKQPLRAILITKGLTEYEPMDEWLAKTKDRKRRKEGFLKLAQALRRVHVHGWLHHCLFPKHVFISEQDGQANVKFIDLEKAKKCFVTRRRIINELTAFIRRVEWRNKAEMLQFLKYYWGVQTLRPEHKRMLRRIHARMHYKKARHAK
jgi:hypothetical protein